MSLTPPGPAVAGASSERVSILLDRLAIPAWLLDAHGVELWRNHLGGGLPETALVLAPAELPGVAEATLCLGRESGEERAIERMIVSESRHRARNIIALAIAIANQSFGSGPVGPVIQSFMDRLRSLDAIASIGCEVTGDRCSISLIVDHVTRRFDDDTGKRFDLAGHALLIPARWAHLIAMVLHELATNAIRHGALRERGGRVMVRWEEIKLTDDERSLKLSWRERGTLPLPPRNNNGFGMKLLCDGIIANRRCDATIKFRPGGLDYSLTIRLPATEVTLEES